MKRQLLHQCAVYAWVVVCFVLTINLALPTCYWAEATEQEELNDWGEEANEKEDARYSDGDDDKQQPILVPKAYLTSSRLFSFLGKNNSTTINDQGKTLLLVRSVKRYVLFHQLKLDC